VGVVAERHLGGVLAGVDNLFPGVGLGIVMGSRLVAMGDKQLAAGIVVADLFGLGRLLLKIGGVGVGFQVLPGVAAGVVQPGGAHLPVVGVPQRAFQFGDVFEQAAEDGPGIGLVGLQ